MARIPPAPIDGPDADEVSVARIQGLRNGTISPLYRTLLHNGDIAAGWCALGTAVRWRSSLDNQLRELLTCLVASLTDAAYEWENHEQLARSAAVTAEQLASLPAWRDCITFTDRERAALAYAEAVVEARVDDELHEATATHFTRRELVEIAATSAYYVATAKFLQASGVGGRS